MDQPILEQTGTYRDFKWCVLFQSFGYRTAYVLVPTWHKVFEVDYNDIDIKCHGGLTYSSHKLLDKDFFGWWIGFDCAHAGDAMDVETQRKYFSNDKQDPYLSMLSYMADDYSSYGSVKNLDFCISECKNIIDQLREME